MYTTQDIYLAAALIALGAELENVDARDRKHQKFELSGELEFDSLSKSYYAGQLNVNASRNKEAIRQLKAAIHASD